MLARTRERKYKAASASARALILVLALDATHVCTILIDYIRDSSRASGTARATRNAYTIGLSAKEIARSKFEVRTMGRLSLKTRSKVIVMWRNGYRVSDSTVKRARRHLGWVSKKTRYCALIREANKEKRLLWCQQRVEQNNLELNNVIFSDESSVHL